MFNSWTKNGEVVSYLSHYDLNVSESAEYVANFYEKYEVAAMDEFFLRNAILIAFLAHNPTLADVLYKEAIRPHEEFAPIEKLLIQKEIPRIRRR